jgi:hypothetical protein
MNHITLQDGNNAPVKIATELIGGVHTFKTETIPQDSTELPIDLRLSKTLGVSATLAVSPAVNDYDVEMNTGHGFIVNDKMAIFEEVDGNARFMVAVVLAVVSDTITLSAPVPYPFSLSAAVITYTPEMNVNGAATPVVHSITNGNSKAVHVTRITLHMTDSTAMDDTRFGGQAALTRGIVFRKRYVDGTYQQYFSAKTNGEIGEIAGGDKSYDDKAGGSLNGFTSRITYNGPDKRGVVIELQQGEAIEMLIQDDLTGLASFTTLVSGHFASS